MAQVYYSKYDLADLLKLSVSTIDNKMKAGEIEYYKIGKSVRFDESMVNEFLSKQTQKMYKRKSFSFRHKDTDVSGIANAFSMVKDGKENE
jgi:excisionase family DNA binding protein|tara:strand:+ start:337 stop:609 length:273 start_codon:yes stop_codon:yes gene_type:complete